MALDGRPSVYISEAFALAFPGDYKAERLVALLTAYFDESGTHAGAQVLSVAGYVATAERWEVFEKDWRQSMAIYGIDYFHMTDFVAGEEQFKDWPKQKRESRLRKLIDIVNRHALAAIGAVIPLDLYGSLSKRDQVVCDSAYRVAAMQCCMEVSRWAKKTYPDAEVAYVFEAGAKGAGKVSEFFLGAMNDPAARKLLRIFSFGFGSKRALVPLQASDILAWELYRTLPSALGMDSRPTRVEDYNRLRRAKFSAFKYPTKENLKTVVKALVGMKLSGTGRKR